MAVFRVEKTNNYTVMSNYHFKEKDMSLKAKGLLSLMLSLPPTWDYSIEGLVTLSSDGEASVRSGIQELEKFGYLDRIQVRENGKIAGVEYIVYEQPKNQHDSIKNVENNRKILEPENLSVENLILGNRPQLNTKELNTKYINSVDATSPHSSSKNTSSKLFSSPKSNSRKVSSWFNKKLNLLDEYEFSEEVHDCLAEFFRGLGEMNALLADTTVRAQLANLIQKVPSDVNKCKVINDTISRGWKSLDYMVNEITGSKNRNGFDTAKNSTNQFYTEEQKQKLREKLNNVSEDDIF